MNLCDALAGQYKQRRLSKRNCWTTERRVSLCGSGPPLALDRYRLWKWVGPMAAGNSWSLATRLRRLEKPANTPTRAMSCCRQQYGHWYSRAAPEMFCHPATSSCATCTNLCRWFLSLPQINFLFPRCSPMSCRLWLTDCAQGTAHGSPSFAMSPFCSFI